jgi:excisionase family DNA binding protein
MRREENPMFLRPVEAAELAGLSTRTIYRAVERGDLRAARLCSRLRISRSDFDEWVARSAVRVASPPPVTRTRDVPAARGSFRRLLVADDPKAAS